MRTVLGKHIEDPDAVFPLIIPFLLLHGAFGIARGEKVDLETSQTS